MIQLHYTAPPSTKHIRQKDLSIFLAVLPKSLLMLSRRFYAYFIDVFLISLGNKLIQMSYLTFMDGHFHFLTPILKKNLYQINLPCLYLTFVAYFSLSLYISEGKTMGKLITGLKVVSDKNGTSLNLRQCFLRASGSLFSAIFLLIPHLIVFFRGDKRGIHDFLGNSRTILECESSKKSLISHPDSNKNQIKAVL